MTTPAGEPGERTEAPSMNDIIRRTLGARQQAARDLLRRWAGGTDDSSTDDGASPSD